MALGLPAVSSCSKRQAASWPQPSSLPYWTEFQSQSNTRQSALQFLGAVRIAHFLLLHLAPALTMRSQLAVLLLISFGALCAAADAGTEQGSALVQLDDASFEHLTQAASGATTGDWLVVFVAPWCGYCQQIKPVLEDLAADLRGEANVATVDATVNSALATRFKIKGYPTLSLFRHGRMYTYSGSRTLEEMIAFVRGGYTDQQGEPVPPPATVWEVVLEEGHRSAEYMFTRFGLGAVVILLTVGMVCGSLLTLLTFRVLDALAPKALRAPTSTPAAAVATPAESSGSISSASPATPAAPLATGAIRRPNTRRRAD